MKLDAVTYLSNAVQKIGSGAVASDSGSHVAGIFGKAANDFEKTIRSHLAEILATCGLNYDRDIRSIIKGPQFEKLTLGNCLAAIREASKLKSAGVTACLPAGRNVSGFLQTLGKINQAWVDLKHGDEVQESVLLAQMKSMLTVYQALKRGGG